MTRHDEFFTRRQAAAVLKHGVLSRYPIVFAGMTGSRAPEVVLFDGYAGPGRYEDGSPGSPFLLLETARHSRSFGKVRCFFSEADMDAFTALQGFLREEAGDLHYEALWGDVERNAPIVVREAAGAPLLTFLDPFGVGLSYEVLTRTLLARPAGVPTEVLLNINVESVRRIGGRLEEQAAGRERAGVEATLQRVDAFMGGGWWREEFRQVRTGSDTATAAEAANHVVDEFCRRVHARTGFSAFKVPIRRRPHHSELFVLTLFYRHDVAPWKFNACASSANEEWRRACMTEDLDRDLSSITVAPSLFGDAEETEAMIREGKVRAWEHQEKAMESEWIDTIAANLEALLQRSPRVTLRLEVREVFGSTLGLARDKHVNQAWKLLAERGIAQPKGSQSRLERAVMERC